MDYLIPRSNEVCSSCEGQERVRGTVLVCPKCREAKGEQGLYSFFKIKFPESEDFADRIPPLIEQTYLIQMYRCHECAGTLDVKDFPEGRAVTALDVDSVLVYRG